MAARKVGDKQEWYDAWRGPGIPEYSLHVVMATDRERGDARGRSFWDSNVISETSSALMARATPVDLLRSGDLV